LLDKIEKLSNLAGKLNRKSDSINSTISSVNKKLAAMNFGVEVWLDEPIVQSRITGVFQGQQVEPYRRVKMLGFCRFSEQAQSTAGLVGSKDVKARWELAVKETLITEPISNFAGMFAFGSAAKRKVSENPTLKELVHAPREVRLAAMHALPKLLDKMLSEGQRMVDNIDDARKAAAKL
jgi:hypothetical protein